MMLNNRMIDIDKAETVEIIVDQANKVWININGQCALRVGMAEIATVDFTKSNGVKRIISASVELAP